VKLNTCFQIWRRLRTHCLLSPYAHIFVIRCRKQSPRAPRKHKGTVIIQTFYAFCIYYTLLWQSRFGCCDFDGFTDFVQGSASVVPQIGHDYFHILSSSLCTKHTVIRHCIFWAISLNSLKASRQRTQYNDWLMIYDWVRDLTVPMHLGLNWRALCAPYQFMGVLVLC